MRSCITNCCIAGHALITCYSAPLFGSDLSDKGALDRKAKGIIEAHGF